MGEMLRLLPLVTALAIARRANVHTGCYACYGCYASKVAWRGEGNHPPTRTSSRVLTEGYGSIFSNFGPWTLDFISAEWANVTACYGAPDCKKSQYSCELLPRYRKNIPAPGGKKSGRPHAQTLVFQPSAFSI